MNGAVYISFFQGQLESVLEQVVQLAVQEISKTVGSGLNALLLETAAKEKDNHHLRLQLQARENRGRASADDSGSTEAEDEQADNGGTKPEQQPRGSSALSGEPAVPIDTRRLEQRGRAVDQLKSVMEQVLNFAMRELTKIVEASFDDLLLEITKMEKEQRALEERLGRSNERGGGDKGRGAGDKGRGTGDKGRGAGDKGRGGGDKGRGGGGRRRGSENDSVSPSGSEDTREEPAEESRQTGPSGGPGPTPVLSVSQDWVPILDKVFGQKWCSNVWQTKEVGGGDSRRSLNEGGGHHSDLVPTPSVILQPSPSSPQQDPRWTPLEDMEVFSPDDEVTAPPPPGPSPGPSPGPPPSPSGRRSSASMLHRLLTLPSQLLDDEDEEAAARETLLALATNGSSDQRDELEPPGRSSREDEEEEEEEEEGDGGDKGRKKKRRRVWSECEECGRRFSRMSLLKAHRQTHAVGDSASADASSPSSPPPGGAVPLRCSECGKRFSSNTRLYSHIRTQHPENQS